MTALREAQPHRQRLVTAGSGFIQVNRQVFHLDRRLVCVKGQPVAVETRFVRYRRRT